MVRAEVLGDEVLGDEVLGDGVPGDDVLEGDGGGAPACCPTSVVTPLADATAVELAQAIAALADPVRLRLLSILGATPGGEVCVCDLVAPLGKSQPTVSHHLKILGGAGLVQGRRRGKWVWYRLAPGAAEAVSADIRRVRDLLGRPGATSTATATPGNAAPLSPGEAVADPRLGDEVPG